MKANREGILSGPARTVVEEVLYAAEAHLKVVRRLARREASRPRTDLHDVIEGMAISVDKLRRLLAGEAGKARPVRIAVSMAGGAVTGVMCDRHAVSRVFDFDATTAELARAEFRDEPNGGKAAERAEREFGELTKGMADARRATGTAWGNAKRADESKTTMCSLCGKPCDARKAHLHQGKLVGDECCWDDRLRASE